MKAKILFLLVVVSLLLVGCNEKDKNGNPAPQGPTWITIEPGCWRIDKYELNAFQEWQLVQGEMFGDCYYQHPETTRTPRPIILVP